MRVAFGISVLTRALETNRPDGIANYSRELLERLNTLEKIHITPFVFATGKHPTCHQAAINLGRFIPQAIFSHFSGLPFPLASKRLPIGIDLIHATDHWVPTMKGVPVLATLMDAIPLSNPEWASSRFRNFKNQLWRQAAQKALHILTISEYSKREIEHWFGIPESRISVAPLGVDKRWFNVPDVQNLQQAITALKLPPRYFLFLGTLQPRKNLMTLIKAHRMLPASLRNEFPLVVAGRAGWACESETAALKEGEHGLLRWLKFVPDGELVPLVRGARALIFPSLHEGFGLPVLEAFAAQTPVICSNTTSLPEVAGDAALQVNPNDASAIADAMDHLAKDESLGNELRRRGLIRAHQFSWENTASKTSEVYQKVLS